MGKLAWAVSLLAGCAAPAFAESATQEDAIVVTAAPLNTFTVDSLQGVVTVEREQLVETMGQGLGETLDRAPGVSSTFFGGGASRPVIRGLGEDRIRILSNGLGQIDASSVSPDHAVTTEGLEAQRIEVLRGPAALAYGGAAVGGVVNVIDDRIAEKLPEKNFSFSGLGGVTLGLDSAEAAGNAVFTLGHVVFNLEGFTRDAGDFDIPGYAFSQTLRDQMIADGADPASFRKDKAPNTLSEAQSAALGVSYVGSRGFIGAAVKKLDSLYGIPEAEEEGGEEEPAIFPGPRIDMEQTRYDVRGALRGDWGFFEELRAETAIVDYAHTEFEPTGEAGTIFSNEGYEARAELTHEAIGPMRGVIGVSGFKTDFAAEGDEAFIAPTVTKDHGVFIVERAEMGAFALEGGARYERRASDNDVHGERAFDLYSVSLGGSWKPMEPLFLGLNLARTERAPTDTELFANGPHLATASFEIGDPELNKEIALSLDATARWTFSRFEIEANAFAMNFEDYVAQIATGAEEDGLPVYLFAQDDAEFRGGELSAKAKLVDTEAWKLSADVAADYVRAELGDGTNLPRIPPRSVSVGLEGEGGNFGGRIEWVNTSAAKDLAPLETPTGGSDVINARLSIRPVSKSDRLVILLDGRNLTDEEVRVHTSFVKDLLPRPGRTFRLVLSSKF